jgi:hypothetical protein
MLMIGKYAVVGGVHAGLFTVLHKGRDEVHDVAN